MPLDQVNNVSGVGVLVPPEITLDIPEVFAELLAPPGTYDYIAYYGGRGSAKSHSVARILLVRAVTTKIRVLCTREFQSSIKDSVHRLLTDTISKMGLGAYFDVTRESIRSHTGSEFLFKGLHHNIQEIKSTEGIDVCWVEEAESLSEDSWLILMPTIRKTNAQVIITYNPSEEDSPTHKRCAVDSPDRLPRMHSRFVSWRDNPWWAETGLERQRVHMQLTDPDAYLWIWEGMPRKLTSRIIFRGRYRVAEFPIPQDITWRYGMDFGFANDPSELLRCFEYEDTLYVRDEITGTGIELDEMPTWMDNVPDVRNWPIKADSSRPETISYLRRKGYNIHAAEKWPGSVEDGITHLKGFKEIVIHPSCKNLIQEARLYSYKVDRVTGDVLPIIVDKHNHSWDALRYSLDGYIQARGGLGVWGKL